MAAITALQAVVEAQRREIEELRAKLRRNSSNSSLPPSSDPPWKPPGDRQVRGKKKRGGQPGHGGQSRRRVEPDKVVDVRPCSCDGCGAALVGEDANPWCHQVTEIPKPVAETVEYRMHELRCECGRITRAPLPDNVPRGAFGPRLLAMVAVCTGAYRLSKRAVEELLRDFFGVELSLGSVSNAERIIAGALEAPHQEILAAVRTARVANADETSWSEGNKLAWLWTGTTPTATAFLIRDRRDAEAAQALLGRNFAGVLITDQYTGYHWLNAERRQLCWAHLIRHFRGLLEWPAAKTFGERLLGFSERLFSLWHGVGDRTITRRQFSSRAGPLIEEFSGLLKEGLEVPHRQVQAMCRMLLRQERSVWTFTRRVGVEPTNNAAERSLRSAVLWRKSCFGTASPRGSRFAERILSVVATLRLRSRNVLDYVTAAATAALGRLPAPALPPPG